MDSEAPARRIVEALAADLPDALGGPSLPNPLGWSVSSIGLRRLMGTMRPVVELARPLAGGAQATLCFIITPTLPSERVFKRTRRYDLVYFSEDVADERQSEVWTRDRATIEAFADWVRVWDETTPA
jgi:hypothetical protein